MDFTPKSPSFFQKASFGASRPIRKLQSHGGSHSLFFLLRRIRWKHLFVLCMMWILTIHYFERTAVLSAFNKCKWENWEQWSKDSDPHHSIIIGDPQIVDAFSYPSRPGLLMWLTRVLADNYHQRNYRLMNKVLKQHSTIFVGDLFDGGREWQDKDWFKEFDRFNRIFPTQKNNRVYQQVPGNHDVGFGTGISYDVYKRFKTFFGDADTYVTLGNHTIILLDTVSLSDSENELVAKSSREFLNSLQREDHPAKELPRIVITHVPLYRNPKEQKCGRYRESTKLFPIVKGKQYQTVIEYKYSREILDWIKPKLILSGDDHDYCHVRHPLGISGLDEQDHVYNEGHDSVGRDFSDEITVKSSAMTGGIRWPAVQLLSLWNPGENIGLNPADSEIWQETCRQTVLHDTFESHLCYLPDFLMPLIWYGVLAVISYLTLFFCTVLPVQASKLESLLAALPIFRQKREILPLSEKLQNDQFKAKAFKRSVMANILCDWQLPIRPDWLSFAVESVVLTAFIMYAFQRSITSI